MKMVSEETQNTSNMLCSNMFKQIEKYTTI